MAPAEQRSVQNLKQNGLSIYSLRTETTNVAHRALPSFSACGQIEAFRVDGMKAELGLLSVSKVSVCK